MRVVFAGIAFVVICSWGVSFAQSPPFQKVTIRGEAKAVYNRVSLLRSGNPKEPFKTENISEYYGTYSIDVDIPNDMKKKNNCLYTDMRFWGDMNKNGIIDSGEPLSKCHFIIWIPSDNIVYMQVYKGQKYRFESSSMNYNYK